MKRLVFSLLLLNMALSPCFSQEAPTYELGSHSTPWSFHKDIIPENGVMCEYYCLTLTEPADLIITLSRSGYQELMELIDAEGDIVVNNDGNNVSTSADYTKTVVNVPAGNYDIYIDYGAASHVSLDIATLTPDARRTATDLGRYTSSFIEKQVTDLSNPYAVYHCNGYGDVKVCCKFTIENSMDVEISTCGSSVSSSEIALLNSQFTEIASSSSNLEGNMCDNSSLAYLLMTNLSAGTYYLLLSSHDVGTLAMSLIGQTAVQLESKETDQNYVAVRTYTNAAGTAWNDRTIYYDEMGREEETALVGASPGGKDIMTLKEYDDFGRIEKEWLAGVAAEGTGTYVEPETLKGLIMGSNGNDEAPYSLTVYEPSPLNRPERNLGPGADWHHHDKYTETFYGVNVQGDGRLDCIRYEASGDQDAFSISCKGSYASGVLTVVSTKDEEGNWSYEFKDRAGNTVLSRQRLNNENIDTYFIRDEWGNLLAVLPPAASAAMKSTGRIWTDTDDEIMHFAYLYVYDERYRQIAKKFPGCDWIYSVYDQSNTPVLTQNGEQRIRGEWSFVIGDAWGRPCVTGTCRNTGLSPGTSLPVTTASYSGSGAYNGYAVSGITLTDPTIMAVNYYDSYDYISNTSLGFSAYGSDATQGSDYNQVDIHAARGQQTGSLTALFGTDGEEMLKSTIYYDYRGRIIQTLSSNLLGGMDKNYVAYDFTENPVQTRHVHTASGKAPCTEDYANTYDHAGRLLTMRHRVNGNGWVTLADKEYDGTGRLKGNKRNGNGDLKTDYTYNVRSWLKSIAGPLFHETLYYNESRGGNAPVYNGNISGMDWQSDGKLRGYDFTYDGLSRLMEARYVENNARSSHYGSSYVYDRMGNVTSLKRRGLQDGGTYGLIDDLTCSYSGNQLVKVDDQVEDPTWQGAFNFMDGVSGDGEYGYDRNGNVTKDLNKAISGIEYNLLNLPQTVSYSDGKSARYVYDVAGRKHRAVYTTALPAMSHATDYCGNLIYESGVLNQVLVDGGYVTFNGSAPVYHFYLQDHLGNNCMVVSQDGTVEQVNHYGPFGGLLSESSGGEVQPYKYNGKELDRMHGLDWYDYGARHYDAALGRWMSMDPLCEKYYSVSPYAYCHNNPVMLVDPDGRDDYFDRYGAFLRHTNEGNNILIQTADGNYANITHVDFSRQTGVLTNIGNHYLSIVDHNYTLTIGQVGDNVPLEAGMANIQGTGKYILYINAEGKVNPEYGNADNLVSSFFHESRHRYDRSTWGGTIGEVEAVLQQTTHSSWLGVSDSFAQSQASYAAAKLNETIKSVNNLNPKLAAAYIQNLNMQFLGVATFSVTNGMVSVVNNLKEIVIYGNKKK